jgi:hypothetical protein
VAVSLFSGTVLKTAEGGSPSVIAGKPVVVFTRLQA